MKEIDQRSKNEIIIRCNCGGGHLLSFMYDLEKNKFSGDEEKSKSKIEGWKDYWISFEERDNSFWERLKDSWNYLFTRKGEICYSGIGLTSKDMDKVIQHFKKYQSL
ncbi:MAG: hypothetical protein Q7R33_04635 [Nitrosarchaeum sp.]|nr:hypothetical protein [Nitrosarchaeum sp.]